MGEAGGAEVKNGFRGGEGGMTEHIGWTEGESWRDYTRPSLPPPLE